MIPKRAGVIYPMLARAGERNAHVPDDDVPTASQIQEKSYFRISKEFGVRIARDINSRRE